MTDPREGACGGDHRRDDRPEQGRSAGDKTHLDEGDSDGALASTPLLPRVRLYQTLRSAHLERAHELEAATIVYQNKRYDFEDPLTVGLDIRRLGPLAGAWQLLRSPVTTLEINEPLMLSSLKTSALALTALWLRHIVGRTRTAVVTYAIANSDPFAEGRDPLVGDGLRKRANRMLARRIWQRVDRAAFGTSAARETYETVLGTVGLRSSALLFPALPAPFRRLGEERPGDAAAASDTGGGTNAAASGSGSDGNDGGADSPGSGCSTHGVSRPRNPNRVIFVGNFTDRKGVRQLLAAWPAVRAAQPAAELVMVGKGRLESEVVAAAASGTGIHVDLDPERREIHDLLDTAAVLVLPSQPSRTWREQVGLPIVEGLSHGLTIVTTEQTGLAEWLGENGHFVVHDPASTAELSAAVLSALTAGRPPGAVLASLPARDGRLAADDWLFSQTLTISDLARAFDG
ncbi:MAG: glycosyl transferase family 1 [Subtercola sp.]|nr:glycosyl transferase family 1 [Subtercola sp.]